MHSGATSRMDIEFYIEIISRARLKSLYEIHVLWACSSYDSAYDQGLWEELLVSASVQGSPSRALRTQDLQRDPMDPSRPSMNTSLK